jgi:hypothetical protein
MRTPTYKISVNTDIAKERERNSKLQSRAAQLEKQIKVLIDDSVALLKARMTELGINATSPGDLLAKAKEIVLRHKQLQAKASKLQAQVASMESEQSRLVALRHQELQEKYNGHTSANGMTNPPQSLTQDYILKEISATLSQRKRLHSQVCILLFDSIYIYIYVLYIYIYVYHHYHHHHNHFSVFSLFFPLFMSITRCTPLNFSTRLCFFFVFFVLFLSKQ